MGDYFLGTIIPWPISYEPQGWLFCDGRRLPIQQWTALYAVIGSRYGGDDRTYFNLPNLNGRVAVGTNNPKASGGSETVTLSSTQMPAHSHVIQTNTKSSIAGSNIPDANKVPGVAKVGLGTTQIYKQYTSPADLVSLNADTLSSFGTPGGHSNLQPYLALNYIICVSGIYPPRE